MTLRNGKEYLKKSCKIYDLSVLPEQIYDVNIDFDEASRQWRKNKIHNGEGFFCYKRYSERIFSKND